MKLIEKKLADKAGLRMTFLTEDIFRVQLTRGNEFKDSGLNRYGFIVPPEGAEPSVGVKKSGSGLTAETKRISVRVNLATGGLTVVNKSTGQTVLQQVGLEFNDAAASARFKAEAKEDWVGFGDQTRERLYHRGCVADLWVRNVVSYLPVPFFMSTRGVGILVNTTHHIVFDMCKSEQSHYSWYDERGVVDYYVFVGANFKEMLDQYTKLTGKPKLPPAWSFGLWHIARTQANDFEVMNDALNFRREGIPCNGISLEPGWMENNYDMSVDKTWSKQRFPVPYWAPNGPHNFFNCLARMGFHLGLWLCQDYDLSYEAERRAGATGKRAEAKFAHGAFHPGAEVDEHFQQPVCSDKIAKPDQPWFEHLKKFVDQGVDFFKHDGSCQVHEHPDRRWGNGMSDAEMHNLYPLLYSKQMQEGFEEYVSCRKPHSDDQSSWDGLPTGPEDQLKSRRAMFFTVCGWAGFQAWGGIWSGDTGGGAGTLCGMLNTSLVGNSWCTNDMEVAQKEGIHFGYLQPWSEICSWSYFRMPWLQGTELCEMHKYYSRLRSQLVPYLYSWAYQSTQTALPLLRPLTLEFQGDSECREIKRQYLLGRDLLVVIYEKKAYFPEGRWKDYWTGKVVEGKQWKTVEWPENRGGGLFVREGGIVPMGPVMQHVREKPLDEVCLCIFPSTTESRFEFYEDDGVSLEHRNGAHAITPISAQRSGSQAVVKVGKPVGSFNGQAKSRTWSFVIALDFAPKSVQANSKPLPKSAWSYDSARKELSIQSQKGPVELRIVG